MCVCIYININTIFIYFYISLSMYLSIFFSVLHRAPTWMKQPSTYDMGFRVLDLGLVLGLPGPQKYVRVGGVWLRVDRP